MANKLSTFQKVLKVIERGCKWFFMVSPALYVIFNYFFIITEEQRTSKMGIAFLVVSLVYMGFCIYFFWINKDIYNN